MPRSKTLTDKVSIYIPHKDQDKKLIERLITLGEKVDRSVNYLVVRAIDEFLVREEKKK